MRSGGIAPLVVVGIAIVAGAAVGAIQGKMTRDAMKEAQEKQENLQNVANAKSETRAKMQGKLQDQINARNIRKTQAQVASAVTYERLLADRTRRETAKTRHNYVESQTPGNRYSRGNPV